METTDEDGKISPCDRFAVKRLAAHDLGDLSGRGRTCRAVAIATCQCSTGHRDTSVGQNLETLTMTFHAESSEPLSGLGVPTCTFTRVTSNVAILTLSIMKP